VAAADLVIVAAEPTRRVLDAALACGRPAHVVGVHPVGQEAAWPGFAELIVTHLTAASAAAAAAALAAKLGVDAVTSRDRPGFLTAAVAYPQLNDAVRMIQDGYATPADIDTAMTLGCGYRAGHFRCSTTSGLRPSSTCFRRCTHPRVTRHSPRRPC
jgi:3-hydroxybutyryl-CoA dehydrogenase